MAATVAVALVALPVIARGAEQPTAEDQARWQKCAGIAQDIMDRTGATYVRTSEIDHNVFMKHPRAPELVMACHSYGKFSASGSWGAGGFPPTGFYDVASVAIGIVTGDNAAAVKRATMMCHDKALKSEDEMAEADLAHTHLECHAFTRDGGAMSVEGWAK